MKNRQELQDFLLELKKSNKLIIVEGPKDKKAMQEAGITNFIVELSKKSLFEIIEDAAKVTHEAVILTDFDKKGKELYGKLKCGLQTYGVKVDLYFREWLQKNTKLSHVEGLGSYLRNLEF
jgi:5S rRNA maturation endonuclease (ribonuclease M5)